MERRSSEGDPRPQISRLLYRFLPWNPGSHLEQWGHKVSGVEVEAERALPVAHDLSQAWNLKAIIAHKPLGLLRLLCQLGRGLDHRKCQRQAQRLPPRTKVPKGSKENNHPSHKGMGGNCLRLEMTEQEVTSNNKSVCFC